jgi:hypothetical protein
MIARKPIGREKVQSFNILFKDILPARHWWLMPIILATWKAEIGKIMV